jgi:hypothetical protein
MTFTLTNMSENEKPLDLGGLSAVEKLEDKNYRRWRVLIEDILRAKGVWKVASTDPTFRVIKMEQDQQSVPAILQCSCVYQNG